MKKSYYSFFGLLTVLFITSVTVKQAKSKRSFEKIIWLETDLNEDSVLFKPYSKAWSFFSWRSPMLDYDGYKSSFNNRNDNVWTILHPKIIDGTIQTYFPYDPDDPFGPGDDGELRFPCLPAPDLNYFTDIQYREQMTFFLGLLGPASDIPLTDEYGDPIIVTLPDGTEYYQYPPPDTLWYADKDIIKYKLRVSILFNKNGVEKKRVIKSIAPVVYTMEEAPDGTKSITGERELFWLNFKELKPILKKAYYFDEDMKPVSYLKYFQQKAYNAALKAN